LVFFEVKNSTEQQTDVARQMCWYLQYLINTISFTTDMYLCVDWPQN